MCEQSVNKVTFGINVQFWLRGNRVGRPRTKDGGVLKLDLCVIVRKNDVRLERRHYRKMMVTSGTHYCFLKTNTVDHGPLRLRVR